MLIYLMVDVYRFLYNSTNNKEQKILGYFKEK